MAGGDVDAPVRGAISCCEQKPPAQFGGKFEHEGFQCKHQEGPLVLVKNTFLELVDRSPTPALVRARTAPPRFSVVGLEENEGNAEDRPDTKPSFTRRQTVPGSGNLHQQQQQLHKQNWESEDEEQQRQRRQQQKHPHQQPLQKLPVAPQRQGLQQKMSQQQQHTSSWQADSMNAEPQKDPRSGTSRDGRKGSPSTHNTSLGNVAKTEGNKQVPQPQTITCTYSVDGGFFWIEWIVDARKLRGSDKHAVSPPFELSFGELFPAATFKIMLYPMNDGKGSACFRKAGGRGSVHLKCEAELAQAIANISFHVSIGTGESSQPSRGPVSHNFSSSALCGLPREEEEWNFNDVVDEESTTFAVCLKIFTIHTGRLARR